MVVGTLQRERESPRVTDGGLLESKQQRQRRRWDNALLPPTQRSHGSCHVEPSSLALWLLLLHTEGRDNEN